MGVNVLGEGGGDGCVVGGGLGRVLSSRRSGKDEPSPGVDVAAASTVPAMHVAGLNPVPVQRDRPGLG